MIVSLLLAQTVHMVYFVPVTYCFLLLSQVNLTPQQDSVSINPAPLRPNPSFNTKFSLEQPHKCVLN